MTTEKFESSSEYNKVKEYYATMSPTGAKLRDTLSHDYKKLLRDALINLMERIQSWKPLFRFDYKDIHIQSLQRKAWKRHCFIGEFTIQSQHFFVKIHNQPYWWYNEVKSQDVISQHIKKINQKITKGVLQEIWDYISNIFNSLIKGNKPISPKKEIVIKVWEPLYWCTMANGMTCIMYPFVNNMELLIDYPYSDTTFRKDIVKCIDHIAKIAEQAGVNDIRPDNIFYTQDDNILRLRIFDTQYYHTQEPKDIHTNWDHTPRPPKPPRHTNT